MSKPDTPCLPECRYSEGLDGVIKTCAPGCPNAPKAEAPRMTTLGKALAEACPLPQAEAPPAPVSEPPIDPRSREAADALIAKLKAENAALEAERNRLLIEAARSDVENAILTAELSDLKHGIPLTYNPNAMCRTGHEMVLFTNGDGQPPLLRCPMCDITEMVQAAERDSSASMELYRSAVARRDDAEAKIATLTAELEETRKTMFRAFDESSALSAEVERLRDLIVLVNCREEYYRGERACFLRCDELVPLHSEARAIRAAREAGKA